MDDSDYVSLLKDNKKRAYAVRIKCILNKEKSDVLMSPQALRAAYDILMANDRKYGGCDEH